MKSRKPKVKKRYRLKLVIEPGTTEDNSWVGYDLDNSKPWPLGTFDTEKEAIAARNSIVVLKT